MKSFISTLWVIVSSQYDGEDEEFDFLEYSLQAVFTRSVIPAVQPFQRAVLIGPCVDTGAKFRRQHVPAKRVQLTQ